MDSIMEESTPRIQSFRDVLVNKNTLLSKCYYDKDQIAPVPTNNSDDPILLTEVKGRESTNHGTILLLWSWEKG